MRNAGRAVAEASAARFSPRPTAVLCGPGNNGGDGWVAARFLKERGWPVWIESLVEPSKLSGDAADAARQWIDARLGDVFVAPKRGPAAELYVDAMFGAGLSRSLDAEAARRARELSKVRQRVVAIDVPSGLDGDTGAPKSEACVRAALTVTFVRKKPAHVLMPGRGYCGEIVLADIGASDEIVTTQKVTLWENDPSLWLNSFPWPSPEAHKHARGHVIVASGGHARSGAARLAARAALRVGAGLVTVLSPAEAMAENAAQLDAVMLREATTLAEYAEAARAAQSVVIGPAFGTTEQHRAALAAVRAVEQRAPAVLDADALTLLAPLQEGTLGQDVATPHIGEFKRLFPELLERSCSRIEAARAAAKHAGGVVLLKGPDTVIAAPDGRAMKHHRHALPRHRGLGRRARGFDWRLDRAGDGNIRGGSRWPGCTARLQRRSDLALSRRICRKYYPAFSSFCGHLAAMLRGAGETVCFGSGFWANDSFSACREAPSRVDAR